MSVLFLPDLDVCDECLQWEHTAIQTWTLVYDESKALQTQLSSLPTELSLQAQSILDGLPIPAESQLQELIRELTLRCDQRRSLSADELTTVHHYRDEVLTGAAVRLGILNQESAMVQWLIANQAAINMSDAWVQSMQSIYASRERIFQDMSANRQKLVERQIALLQGNPVVNVDLNILQGF